MEKSDEKLEPYPPVRKFSKNDNKSFKYVI